MNQQLTINWDYKLLQDFMTNMLLIVVESLFNKAMKLYTQIPISLPSINFNYQKFSKLVTFECE